MTVKHGIGAGILINGRLFQGDGGGAGEIGHVVVQENGTLCRCGKHGCLETVASAGAVVQRAMALAPKHSDFAWQRTSRIFRWMRLNRLGYQTTYLPGKLCWMQPIS